jgi:outer membrane lipoprotein-sorting protein
MKCIVPLYAGIVGALILGGSGWLAISPVSAQSSPAVVPQAPPQKTDAEHLNLFLLAIRDFSQGNAIKTTSNLSLQVTMQGAKVEENIQIQAIARRPNQFRTDVVFGDVAFGSQRNTSKRRYQIVSDGKTVWIYRPDTQEYSVQTYAEFDKSNDTFLIGASSFFLSLPADLESSFSDGNLAAIASNPTLVAAMYKEMETQFRGYQQDKTGKNFAVYSMKESKSPEQLNIDLWVEPQTAALQKFQISGKHKDSDVKIGVEIVDRIANPKIEPNTFRFVVPKGAKRLKTLSISPLGE